MDKYTRELQKETFELIAKIIELINIIGWDEHEGYTFKDGERWYKFQPEEDNEHE
jgi:hypothetical protein